MELLIAIVVVVALIYAYRERAKERPGRAAEEAAEQCVKIAQEMRWAMEAAQKYPPGSTERHERVQKAQEKLRRIEFIASRHPEITLRDLDAVRWQLRALQGERPRPAPLRAAQPAAEGRIMVCLIDTETTGLSHQDEPITLAALLLEVDMPKGHLVREVERIYEMREPSVPIHPRAAAVHGLTLEDLRGKRFDEQRILSIIRQADLLIAHNAHFDRRMLSRIIPEVDGMSWRCSVRQISWPTPNKKLDTVCQHFGIQRQEPHNAMSDVQALSECLFQPTGKTSRSRSYLGECLARR